MPRTSPGHGQVTQLPSKGDVKIARKPFLSKDLPILVCWQSLPFVLTGLKYQVWNFSLGNTIPKWATIDTFTYYVRGEGKLLPLLGTQEVISSQKLIRSVHWKENWVRKLGHRRGKFWWDHREKIFYWVTELLGKEWGFDVQEHGK